jgi:hypothetical protein
MTGQVRQGVFLLVLAGLFACLGCGRSGPQPIPVRGTVNCDGEPLAEGTISFRTVATGTIDTLPVKNGRFEGQAVEGENRRVEVNAYRKMVVGTGAMSGEVQENTIARRYNLDSTLTATVSRAGANEFKFDVSRK